MKSIIHEVAVAVAVAVLARGGGGRVCAPTCVSMATDRDMDARQPIVPLIEGKQIRYFKALQRLNYLRLILKAA